VDEQTSIFDTPVEKMYRRQGPETSRQAAKVAKFSAGTQKHRLLTVYADHESGLTDEEAAMLSGLIENPSCCWWKRSNELREKNYIEETGETRVGRSGAQRMVCKITEAGFMAISI
jgi:hypothetical protein